MQPAMDFGYWLGAAVPKIPKRPERQKLHLTFQSFQNYQCVYGKGAVMKRFLILAAILCASTMAAAQKADVAFVVGGSFVSDTNATLLPPFPTAAATIKTDHHLFLKGALGVRLLNAHLVSLHAELPVAGIPSTKLSETITATTLDHISTVFITPGLRIKIQIGRAHV